MIDASTLRAALQVPWQHGVHVDLKNVVCDGCLDLDGIDVAGFDATGARFPDGVRATGTRFLGLSWFGGVRFGAATSFAGAVFHNDARFETCVFEGFAPFAGAEFRGIARFDHARFGHGASFEGMTAYGNTSLAHAVFDGDTRFAGAEWLGGLWAEGTQLPAEVDLRDTQVHGRLWLRDAKRANHALDQDRFGMRFGYTYR